MSKTATTFITKVRNSFDNALKAGHLIFSETSVEYILDHGVNFQVRLAPSLAKKPEKADTKAPENTNGNNENNNLKKRNPFLPYDENMFVDLLGDRHVCLLNKFCIVRDHLLVVTKGSVIVHYPTLTLSTYKGNIWILTRIKSDFQSQLDPLNESDFSAIYECLRRVERDGGQPYLVFFNAGELSGASQPHKHAQIIPITEELPIERLIRSDFKAMVGSKHEPMSLPSLAVDNYFHFIPSLFTQHNPSQTLYSIYSCLLTKMNSNYSPPYPHHHPYLSYNFIMTSSWMLMVPRKEEKYENVSVNSVGWAGMFLVKTGAEKDIVKTAGPMGVLKNLGFERKIGEQSSF
ncbi:ATP adenylyltransferase-domain-containing protein [Paraphysoderma sedebokerense]|nr:ATP adenylyltransferase-domain-containing protein [Paraphysoderma sedebokerense]